jgi:hypothetical protein
MIAIDNAFIEGTFSAPPATPRRRGAERRHFTKPIIFLTSCPLDAIAFAFLTLGCDMLYEIRAEGRTSLRPSNFQIFGRIYRLSPPSTQQRKRQPLDSAARKESNVPEA